MFDADEPNSFFRRLARLANSEEWSAKKTYHKALVHISETQEWIATKIEEKFGAAVAENKFPKIEEIEQVTLETVDPRSTKQLLLDKFERVKVSVDVPVEQTRQRLQDLFRRAVPEATKETLELFVLRQLIKSAPECWRLRLKEADLKTIQEVESKIRTLQDAGRSEKASIGTNIQVRRAQTEGNIQREPIRCAQCKLRGHHMSDCRTKCHRCGTQGHISQNCRRPKGPVNNQKKFTGPGKTGNVRRMVGYFDWEKTQEKVAGPEEPVAQDREVQAEIVDERITDEEEFMECQEEYEDRVSLPDSEGENSENQIVSTKVSAIRRGVVLSPDESMEFKLIFGYQGNLVKTVVDTGCRFNILREDFYKSLCPEIPLTPTCIGMVCLNKSSVQTLGEIELESEVDATLRKLRWIVVQTATDEILLGMEGAVALELTLEARTLRVSTQNDSREQRIEAMLDRYPDVFSKDQYDVGKVDYKHSIPTTDERPIFRKEYKVPVNFESKARVMLKEMIKRGLIEECQSNWACPAIFLDKGNGMLRLVLNYQALNEKTIFDPMPIPNMYSIVRKLSNGVLFTRLDARNSFWHIGLREEDRDKTSFVTMGKQYRFLVMPMGLKSAPATLTRALAITLKDDIESGQVHIFYDDTIIATDCPEDQEGAHLFRVNSVLKKLNEAAWKLNKEKCEFMKTEITALGHKIRQGKIQITPSYMREMADWKIPENKKELQRFTGFAGYHQKFIKDYSKIVKPLTDLLGDVPYEIKDEQREAFQTIKELLTSKPVLRDYDPDKDLTLITDASDSGWGAYLEQEQHPIDYASGKWNSTQQRYSTSKKELKAVLNAIKKFSYFLAGKHFTLVTDHEALARGIKPNCSDSELYRWSRKIDPYSFSVVHRMGSQIAQADALSRKPESNQLRRIKDCTEFQTELKNDEVLWYIQSILEGTALTRPTEPDVRGELEFYESQIEKGNLKLADDKIYIKIDNDNKLIVPKSLKKLIFSYAHNHELAGHQGFKRTKARIGEKYFWYKIAADVQKWKTECRTCAKHDIKRQAPGVSKSTVPVKGIALSQWSMDILGPLPQSEQGNRYILVLSDLFTKWIELYALPDQQSNQIINCLMDLICRYSIPGSILTDNGTNFSSRCYKLMLQSMQIREIHTTPYHPQTDGQTERFNATLMQALRKYIEEEPRGWDTKLQFVAFSYRTSVHSVTGYTPYQLVFGRRAREPVHVCLGEETNNQRKYLENFLEAEQWRENALERINTEKDGRIEEKECKYQEGDLIMLKNLAPKSKLSPKYRGPFKIIKCQNPDFIIDLDGTQKKMHGQHLKPFLKRGDLDILDVSTGAEATDDKKDNLDETEESEDDELIELSEEWLGSQSEDQISMNSNNTESTQSSSSKLFNFLPIESRSGRKITKTKKYL
jgi:hypothetical protein